MKKVIISLVIMLTGLSTSLFALEWGGLINNLSNASTPKFDSIDNVVFNQTDDLYLWMNTSLVKDKSLKLSAEGMYKFNFSRSVGQNSFKNIIDLNILKFSGKWSISSRNILLDIGRFSYSDKANAYFIQKSDGLNLKFNSRTINLGLYAGYTGLQNRQTVIMENDKDKAVSKNLYELCYGYVPVMFDVTFNKVGQNALGLQASYFVDITGNNKNKGYGTIFMNGPFFKFGSYLVNVVVGTENFKNVMVSSTFDITLFLTQSIMVSMGAEYASGNNKYLSKFTPVTQKYVCANPIEESLNDVVVPRLTGIFMFGDAVITLNEKLDLGLYNKKVHVNGLGSTLSVVYNIFSDLQIGATFNAFNSFESKDKNYYTLAVNAALSF